MKKLTALSLVLSATVFTAVSWANTTNTQETPTTQENQKPTAPVLSPQVAKLIAQRPSLIARIQPHGKVCFDGQECDINISVLAAAVDGQPRDGESIYKAVCHTCHDSGLVGAPKFGDKGAWASRIGKGKATLYNSAINGLNAMPAKGGNDSLQDEEVQNAVDYIIQKSS